MEIQAQVQKFSFVNQRNDRERGRGGIRAKRTFPITPITPGNKKKKKKKKRKKGKRKRKIRMHGKFISIGPSYRRRFSEYWVDALLNFDSSKTHTRSILSIFVDTDIQIED